MLWSQKNPLKDPGDGLELTDALLHDRSIALI